MTSWNLEEGYGFITPDDGSGNPFCHRSALVDGEECIKNGLAVQYTVVFDKTKQKHRAGTVESYCKYTRNCVLEIEVVGNTMMMSWQQHTAR